MALLSPLGKFDRGYSYVIREGTSRRTQRAFLKERSSDELRKVYYALQYELRTRREGRTIRRQNGKRNTGAGPSRRWRPIDTKRAALLPLISSELRRRGENVRSSTGS